MMTAALILILTAQRSDLSPSPVSHGSEWATMISQRMSQIMAQKGDAPSAPAETGKMPTGLKTVTADRNFYGFDGERFRVLTEAEVRELMAAENEKFRYLFEAQALLKSHDLARAKLLIASNVEDPAENVLASRILAEIAIHEHCYIDALMLLAPFIEDSGDKLLLLIAAHAAAMVDQVFDGQKQFTDGYVAQHNGLMDDIALALNKNGVLVSSRLSSAIALATWYGGHNFEEDSKRYFTRALVFDAENVLANFMLGQIYARQKLWQKSSDCFEIASLHATGSLKKFATRGHLKAEGKLEMQRRGGGG